MSEHRGVLGRRRTPDSHCHHHGTQETQVDSNVPVEYMYPKIVCMGTHNCVKLGMSMFSLAYGLIPA